MYWKMRIIKGPTRVGELLTLKPGAQSCGRATLNPIALPGEKISKKHCEFKVLGTKLTVVDLASSNGTYLNGEKIKEANLKANDRLQLGEYLLEVLEP
jgi:pSer/pThr/pTyr-binding forkhead associated (FHA) protein